MLGYEINFLSEGYLDERCLKLILSRHLLSFFKHMYFGLNGGFSAYSAFLAVEYILI